jgi:ATP-dependent RNA helicase DeaD
MLDPKKRQTEALVLCPTRELAVQVAAELRKLARFRKDIVIIPVYGGQAIRLQIASLKKGVHIVVGTPGRMIDHMKRRTIKLSTVTKVVLDEADEMLNMGFLEDIETILDATSATRQTLLFSATMPESIRRLAGKYQKNPSLVKVVGDELTVSEVDQSYIEVRPGKKLNLLRKIVDNYKF